MSDKRTMSRCIYGIHPCDPDKRCRTPVKNKGMYCGFHSFYKGDNKHDQRIEMNKSGVCRSDLRKREDYQKEYHKKRRIDLMKRGLCIKCGRKNDRLGTYLSCHNCSYIEKVRKNHRGK